LSENEPSDVATEVYQYSILQGPQDLQLYIPSEGAVCMHQCAEFAHAGQKYNKQTTEQESQRYVGLGPEIFS